jgi:hypothetical protein
MQKEFNGGKDSEDSLDEVKKEGLESYRSTLQVRRANFRVAVQDLEVRRVN